jgi:hypothetical protein
MAAAAAVAALPATQCQLAAQVRTPLGKTKAIAAVAADALVAAVIAAAILPCCCCTA